VILTALAAALTRRARSEDDNGEQPAFNVHDRRFADRLAVHEARTEADRWSMVVRPRA